MTEDEALSAELAEFARWLYTQQGVLAQEQDECNLEVEESQRDD